jgi:hypothetical protein
MKKLLLSLFIFCSVFSSAQTPGEWVWLSGDSITSNGNFGIQGVPSPTNVPPSLYEACEWTDNNGNFWLFGGGRPGSFYADVWKYNPTTNEWTWMKGPGTVNYAGSYGTQGVPSPTNNPRSTSFGAHSWVDLAGNFWTFGGAGTGSGVYSDLWKYDLSTNEWTWMKGPGTLSYAGSYGIKGVPSPTNNPPSRTETAASWTDNAGDLWMFGGTGPSQINTYNDLWRYNIASNMWTWMKGSSLPDQPTVSGPVGMEDSTYTPGARWVYPRWKDLNGNLWLLGGDESWNSSNGTKTDLWRFNPLTNNWALMNGDTLGNVNRVNGTMCTGDSVSRPNGTIECRAAWKDPNGNFYGWLFGNGIYNSLWMYCMQTGEWAIVKGDSGLVPAVWGTRGVPSPTNMPPRRNGSIGWTDGNGHFYMFGGGGNEWYNALWMYTIDPCCSACPQPKDILSFTVTDASVCSGSCINIINNSQSYSTYQWIFEGGNPSTSNDFNPQNICYSEPGFYDITLIATRCGSTDTLIMTNMITVTPLPSQSIQQSGDTLFSNTGFATYQWYFNDTLIVGATNYFYLATVSGNYTVISIDSNGCQAEDSIFVLVTAVLPLSFHNENAIKSYPNPVSSTLFIAIPASVQSATVKIYNIVGEAVKIIQQEIKDRIISVDVSNLSSGMFLLEVSSAEKVLRSKFVKQ